MRSTDTGLYFARISHIKVRLIKVLLENGWNFKRMITEGDVIIPPSVIKRNQNKDQL